jgi:hypothetical protein
MSTKFGERKGDAESRIKARRLVAEFIEPRRKRIPKETVDAGLEELLLALAGSHVQGRRIMLAEGPRSLFELATSVFAACLDELPQLEFAGADPDSVALHLAAEREISDAWTGRGEKVDYASALRRAVEKRETAIHPSDIDQESKQLDRAAQAEIESAWRNRGEKLSYLDALRRAVEKR